MLKVTTKGFTKLDRVLKTESKRQEKALNTAVKVEGFRLWRTLIREIKAGAPGGKGYDPLATIARRISGGRLRSRKPFTRLHSTRHQRGIAKGILPIRYSSFQIGDNFEMRVGFVNTRLERLSHSWHKILIGLQEGSDRPITKTQRKILAARGARMPERSKLRKHFFIRKSTKYFRTPARPIIDPFWRAHKKEAWLNIQKNYRLKMKGQRI